MFTVPQYNGPELPPETKRLLQRLTENGFTAQVTNRAGKTIRILNNGIWYGYINSTVLSAKAVLGYRFTAWGYPPNNACPPLISGRLAKEFASRYSCKEEDLVIQSGSGGNAGRTFLVIRNPEVALRAMLKDAAYPIDPGAHI